MEIFSLNRKNIHTILYAYLFPDFTLANVKEPANDMEIVQNPKHGIPSLRADLYLKLKYKI